MTDYYTLRVGRDVYVGEGSIVLAEDPWPYLQIYPSVNETNSQIPLYIAVVLSSDGDGFESIGALPGIQIALDYINNEPSLLPGYSLHYTFLDSECERSKALDTYFTQITSNAPTKVGWIGSGCSPATEPTAELTQYHNITQLSCTSSSPDLEDRERFRYYFQLLSSEAIGAYGVYMIIKHFGWKRVGIITQGENLFVGTAERLKKVLSDDGEIEYIEWYIRTKQDIINSEILDSQIRIYVVLMYPGRASELFCEAYRQGFHPPKYLFLTHGWYREQWWKEGYISEYYNCSGEDLSRVALNNVGVLLSEFPEDPNTVDTTNTTLSEFMSLYQQLVMRDITVHDDFAEYINNTFYYAYHCHEATIAFAYALNKTMTDLKENETLHKEAAKLSEIPEGEHFTMANFTYANYAIVSRMFQHLENTNFPGISGNDVRFNDHGIRVIDKMIISQYQKDRTGALVRKEIGFVVHSESNTTFLPSVNPFSFSDGIPNDGIPIDVVVKISPVLTTIYIILATIGLIFTAICIAFNVIFRDMRLIRLSSPNLNYFILFGALILYLNIIVIVIPQSNQNFSAIFCNIHPWLLSIGYSFCYGTIIIKMIRIWVIFNNPLELKASLLTCDCLLCKIPLQPMFRDKPMALFVLCLGVIDIVILLLYTITEGIRNNLGVKLTPNQELPEETIGATEECYKYFLYVCKSEGQLILYGILFSYKGLLQAIALLLAFRTRKVKVKGLDDSKYITASTYVTSIVLTVIIISTYSLMDYVNAYPAVVGMGLLLGTTSILGLVFVPKMIGLYKDPKGNNITTVFPPSSDDTFTKYGQVLNLQRRVTELEENLREQIQRMSSYPCVKENGVVEHSAVLNRAMRGRSASI